MSLSKKLIYNVILIELNKTFNKIKLNSTVIISKIIINSLPTEVTLILIPI